MCCLQHHRFLRTPLRQSSDQFLLSLRLQISGQKHTGISKISQQHQGVSIGIVCRHSLPGMETGKGSSTDLPVLSGSQIRDDRPVIPRKTVHCGKNRPVFFGFRLFLDIRQHYLNDLQVILLCQHQQLRDSIDVVCVSVRYKDCIQPANPIVFQRRQTHISSDFRPTAAAAVI